MSKRFMVAITGSADEDNTITRHLMAKPSWGVWHYVSRVWLLAGVPDSITPKSLHGELAALPGLSATIMIVIEIADNPKYWGIAAEGAWDWMDKVTFGTAE